MTKINDFRNDLPVWVPLFILVTGFVHAVTNAVWLKLAFHPEISWFDFMSNLVSKPNEFFWIIVILYAFNLLAVIIAFLMLYGRSVSNRQKKPN